MTATIPVANVGHTEGSIGICGPMAVVIASWPASLGDPLLLPPLLPLLLLPPLLLPPLLLPPLLLLPLLPPDPLEPLPEPELLLLGQGHALYVPDPHD